MLAKSLFLLMASFAVGSVTLQALETPTARLLRVSLLEGDVTYQRPDLDRWVDLSINTPILEGDKIWAGRGGRAEVEFENGSFARISENTIIEFSRLGDFNSREGMEARLIQGVGSFEARPEALFTVNAPLFSASTKHPASFRLDVDPDGSSRLVVFDGSLEVSGQSARLFVRRGELVRFLSQDADRYYLETNYVKDDWDRWNDERHDYLTRITQEQLHYGDSGWTTADLYNYGSWYDAPTYGRVWRPNAVEPDWVPFRSGRWCWYPSYGWTWVSYEPWGWIPYHYGRWANVSGFGWSWVPGPRYVSWCPGAVNWVQGTQWVGWVPLAPHEPWYGHGRGNVFVSKNFAHRGSVTYLPHDSFVNGVPPRGFHSPRDPYTDGRIIAGQPNVTPTPASRMPVAGNPAARVFTNEDLEARRNMRERIVNAGRISRSQDRGTEMEGLRQQRGGLNSGPASGFTSSTSGATARGIRSIPSVSSSVPPAPAHSYHDNNDTNAPRSTQNQRVYRLDSPTMGPSVSREPRSTWVRPTAPVAHPPLDSTPGAVSVPGSDDRFLNRQRVYEIYRGRADSGRTDRYSSQPLQRESPSSRYSPYAPPPSSPPAMTHPSGPPASYNGPAVRPVGPPPSYQGPSSGRESFSRSQSSSSSSGTSRQESRGAIRGRTGR